MTEVTLAFFRIVWLAFYLALLVLWGASAISLEVVTIAAVATPVVYFFIHERAGYFMSAELRLAKARLIKNASLSLLMTSALFIGAMVSAPEKLYGILTAVYIIVMFLIIGALIYFASIRSDTSS